MIAAILQPYFFPYIGYFQLMSAVDTFVVFDDVQYIDRGWVNRNRIRENGAAAWWTLPVRKGSHLQPINHRHYLLEEAPRLARRLEAAYAKHPHAPAVLPLVRQVLAFGDSNVATFNANLLETVARELGIGCRIRMSSAIEKPDELTGSEKVIDLCRRIGADAYINPIGGMDLYDPARFRAEGIGLSFLRTRSSPAMLADGPVHLSIIDGLMGAGFSAAAEMLPEYDLESAG